jgi:hypothetical protein
MTHALNLLDRQLEIPMDIAKSVVLDGKNSYPATEVMWPKYFGDIEVLVWYMKCSRPLDTINSVT